MSKDSSTSSCRCPRVRLIRHRRSRPSRAWTIRHRPISSQSFAALMPPPRSASAPAPDCRRGRADRTRPAVFPLRDADRLNRFQPVLYLIPRDTVYAVPSPPTLSASSFMRSPTTSAISCARWAMPKAAEAWSLTSLRDKLIKIGAKVVSHGRYVTFQMGRDRHSEKFVRRDFASLRLSPNPVSQASPTGPR